MATLCLVLVMQVTDFMVQSNSLNVTALNSSMMSLQKLNELELERQTLYKLHRFDRQFSETPGNYLGRLYEVYAVLIAHYGRYYSSKELDDLTKEAEEIASLLKLKPLAHEVPESFFAEKSSFRTLLTNINNMRSHWNYSRILARSSMQLLDMLQVTQVINSLNQLFNTTGGPELFFNLLDEARDALALLGILVYTLRIIHDLCVIAMHLIRASKQKDVAVSTVFWHEMQKTFLVLLSDINWLFACTLNAFRELLQLTSTTINAVFLLAYICDIPIILADMYLKISQLKSYKTALEANTKEQQPWTHRQIAWIQGEIDIYTSYSLINLAAAGLFVSVFALTLGISSPVAAPVFALLSMIGFYMYSMASDYKHIKELEQHSRFAQLEHNATAAAQFKQEALEASYEFWKQLTLNVCGTALILCVCSVSWPCAILVGASLICYKIYNQRPQEHHKHSLDFMPSWSV